VRLAWLLSSMVVVSLHGADVSKVELNVYVTSAQVEERKQVDDATRNQLKAKRDAAREARKALEKSLKDQHGKKRESWPPEKDDELYRAEEAEALANVDYEYRKIDLKGLKDSLKDVVESIEGKGLAGRKEGITLVNSASEAHLVVEIAGRRSEKTLPTQFKPDRCYVLFNVGAGGKVDAARFAKVPAEYRPKRGFPWPLVWKVQNPKPERPLFSFEAYNGGGNEFGCMSAAANAASSVAQQFVQDHHDALAADATK
jgi:hypothetical protein